MSIITTRFCPRHGMTTFKQANERSKCYCRLCASENVSKRRRELKQKMVNLKGGKCQRCGYDKCLQSLEFHHIDPTQKDLQISSYGILEFSKLQRELDKCILVCSNCHREIHKEIEAAKQEMLNQEYAKNVQLAIENGQQTVRRSSTKIILDLQVVKELIASGLNQSAISHRLNCSVSTLKRFISERGINMRTSKRPSKEEYDEYMKTHSAKQFMIDFRISMETYLKWKRKYFS